MAAFNKGDAKAVAALWTEDAQYTDETGLSYVGRDAIERATRSSSRKTAGHRFESPSTHCDY